MIYAVGDIHGQKTQMDRALALIGADGGTGAEVVFVGDYTDRGPDTRGVIDVLIAGVETGRNWTVLRGNHDRMFTRFVRDGVIDDPQIASGKGWLHPALGGRDTLRSYGVTLPDTDAEIRDPGLVDEIAKEARAKVPETHLDFLESRPLWYRTEVAIFVHAGIRPGIEMADQEEDDLIWIRNGWLDDTRDHGTMIVHGHTALDEPAHHGNRINIDGGAGYGRPLVPVHFDGDDWHTVHETGRSLLWPRAE